jgi:drug/metabolite transporter (DMT)-like permease
MSLPAAGLDRKRLGLLIGLAGAFAYGVNVPFASMAQVEGVTAQQMSFYRSLAMVIGIAAAGIVLRHRLVPAPEHRWPVILAGVMSGCVALAYLASVKFNPVALSVVLLYTYPLIIIVLEALVTRRWPGALRIGVFTAAFIGIVIAVGPDMAGASPLGMGLALFAGFASAVLYVVAARIPGGEAAPMLAMQIIVMLMSATVMAATGDSFDPHVFLAAPWSSGLAMLGYAIGFFSIVLAAPMIGSANLGLVFLIEPVVGIVSAALLLGQVPAPLQWGGVAIILAALAVDAAASARQSDGAAQG